jgi:conserved oligomeric Golgi complex subunit 3
MKRLLIFRIFQNNIIGCFVRLEQLLMTNGYSKEDLIIVNIPTADQVSVLISSANLIADQQESMRKSSISDGPLRKISTSSIEKKVSFDRGVSIQEEEIPSPPTNDPTTPATIVENDKTSNS